MGERLNLELVDLEIILERNGLGDKIKKIKEKYDKEFPNQPRRKSHLYSRELYQLYQKYVTNLNQK